MRELCLDARDVREQHDSERLLALHEQASGQFLLPTAEDRGLQRSDEQLPMVSQGLVLER